MSDDPRWERWLYATHRRAELWEWASKLRYFRFCRAFGGHANDGDQLLVALRTPTESALGQLFSCLGVAATPIPPDTPRRQRGVAYSAAEYLAFPTPTDRFLDLRQPGHVEIDGRRAFIWVYADRLTISVSDREDPFVVTAHTVESALAIEARLSPLATQVIDPPLDNRHCICPKYYPDIWA